MVITSPCAASIRALAGQQARKRLVGGGTGDQAVANTNLCWNGLGAMYGSEQPTPGFHPHKRLCVNLEKTASSCVLAGGRLVMAWSWSGTNSFAAVMPPSPKCPTPLSLPQGVDGHAVERSAGWGKVRSCSAPASGSGTGGQFICWWKGWARRAGTGTYGSEPAGPGRATAWPRRRSMQEGRPSGRLWV